MSEQKTFKSVSSASTGDITYVRASEAKPGIVAEGIFSGTQQNKLEPTKLDYIIESLDADSSGNKKKTIVNSAGNLGYKMKSVNVGDLIQVEYKGRVKATTGRAAGKLVHDFDVLRAE